MNRLRYLPQSLRSMCVAFAASPIAFLGWAALHTPELGGLPPWHALLLAVAYIAMPLVLANLIVQRHPLFLYTLIGECSALLALAFVLPARTMPSLFYVHYVYVLMMVVMAMMLINRDILFPFVLPGYRGWRQAPRLSVNQRVRVTVPRLDATMNLMIEDCSLTGLALYGGEGALEEVLTQVVKNEPMLIQCTVGNEQHDLVMDFKWYSRLSSVAKLGFRAREALPMSRLFDALHLNSPSRTRMRKLQGAWTNRHVRRILNVMLATLLTGALILPPLLSANAPRLFSARAGVTAPDKAPSPSQKAAPKRDKTHP